MKMQCRGTTKAGSQCKRTTGLVNGYCSYHISQWDGKEEPKEEERVDLSKSSTTPDSTDSKNEPKISEKFTIDDNDIKEIDMSSSLETLKKGSYFLIGIAACVLVGYAVYKVVRLFTRK